MSPKSITIIVAAAVALGLRYRPKLNSIARTGTQQLSSKQLTFRM